MAYGGRLQQFWNPRPAYEGTTLPSPDDSEGIFVENIREIYPTYTAPLPSR